MAIKNEQCKVEMPTAYKEGIGGDTMLLAEKRKWKYGFNKMRDKLESELNKAK